MATMLCELAAAQGDVWRERYEDEDEAALRLKEYRNLRSQLIGAVEFSLRARKQRLEREKRKDPWLALSFADYGCLVAKSRTRNSFTATRSPVWTRLPTRVARRRSRCSANSDVCPSRWRRSRRCSACRGKAPVTKVAQGPALSRGTVSTLWNRAKPRFPARQEANARAEIYKRSRRRWEQTRGRRSRSREARAAAIFCFGSVRRTRHRAADVPRDSARRVCKSFGRAAGRTG